MVALTGTFHDDAVSLKSTFFLLSAFAPFAAQNACIGPIAFAGWTYQNASRLEVMILPPVRPQLAKETAFSSRSRTPSFFVRCRVTFGGAHFLQLLLTLCTLPYGAQLWNLDRSQGGDADQCGNANHDQFLRDQRMQFPLNQTVSAKFRPGSYCSTVLIVFFDSDDS